jgi:hypothetical protein
MAFTNKAAFAVSVTPKGVLAEVNNTNVEMSVMHENVRKTLGGGGEITGDDDTIDGGWADGVNTPIDSNGGAHGITFDAQVNLLHIKHTGKLLGTDTACADADTVQVNHDGDIIAELKSGEAMVLPRPSALNLTFASGSADVDVEVTCIGT